MGCCTCTSVLLVGISAALYMLLGITITGGAIAAMVTHAKDVVPMWYSGVMLGVGLIIVIAAIVGFLAICRKRQTKCWTGIFMVLTLLVLCMSVIFTGVAWKTEEALEAANNQNFVDISGIEKKAAESLKSAFVTTFNKCEAEVHLKSGTTDHYFVECDDDDLEFIEDAINKACLSDSVAITSDYIECYSDDSWWAHEEGVNARPLWLPPAEGSINTPKGLFCQCADEVVDSISKYYSVGKWIALGVCVFYLLVFISLCYLCCGVKTFEEEKLTELKVENYWTRP